MISFRDRRGAAERPADTAPFIPNIFQANKTRGDLNARRGVNDRLSVRRSMPIFRWWPLCFCSRPVHLPMERCSSFFHNSFPDLTAAGVTRGRDCLCIGSRSCCAQVIDILTYISRSVGQLGGRCRCFGKRWPVGGRIINSHLLLFLLVSAPLVRCHVSNSLYSGRLLLLLLLLLLLCNRKGQRNHFTHYPLGFQTRFHAPLFFLNQSVGGWAAGSGRRSGAFGFCCWGHIPLPCL